MSEAPDVRHKMADLVDKLMDRAAQAADHGNDKLALEAIRGLTEIMKKFDPDDGKLGAEHVLAEARQVLQEMWSDDLHCPKCDAELKPKPAKAAVRKRTPRRAK